MIAKIAVEAANFAIDKPYSYNAPHGTALLPGMRVQVPLLLCYPLQQSMILSIL